MMTKQTPLYAQHVEAQARIVEFAGWQMPLHYGSQLNEHHAVRRAVGLFDVSHMALTDLDGDNARALLRALLANDVAKLDDKPGSALYSCLLNTDGGVIDDLIVYHRGPGRYRIISNAATRERVRPYLDEQAQAHAVDVTAPDDVAMIAVQGPEAVAAVTAVLPAAAGEAVSALAPFTSLELGETMVARTGYTGEDGFELVVPAAAAPALWQQLCAVGGVPCGLGARDTLRLEAGLNLNGHEMDESTSPLHAGLGWTVAWAPAERDFVGRAALEAERQQGPQWRLIGLLVAGRAPARAGYPVQTGAGPGVVTSGAHAPTLGAPIALARVPAAAGDDSEFAVVIRGRETPARAVRPPFVRRGKVRV